MPLFSDEVFGLGDRIATGLRRRTAQEQVALLRRQFVASCILTRSP